MRLIEMRVETKKGNQFKVLLKAKRVVCFHCDGEGKHVNPSIDGNGISMREFDEDPDFRESYYRGDYDVTCNVCKGEKVIDQVDWDALTPKMRDRIERSMASDAEHEREVASERKRGC